MRVWSSVAVAALCASCSDRPSLGDTMEKTAILFRGMAIQSADFARHERREVEKWSKNYGEACAQVAAQLAGKAMTPSCDEDLAQILSGKGDKANPPWAASGDPTGAGRMAEFSRKTLIGDLAFAQSQEVFARKNADQYVKMCELLAKRRGAAALSISCADDAAKILEGTADVSRTPWGARRPSAEPHDFVASERPAVSGESDVRPRPSRPEELIRTGAVLLAKMAKLNQGSQSDVAQAKTAAEKYLVACKRLQEAQKPKVFSPTCDADYANIVAGTATGSDHLPWDVGEAADAGRPARRHE